MSKKYVIKTSLDDSQIAASLKRQNAAYGGMEAAAKKALEAVEKVMAKAGNFADAAAKAEGRRVAATAAASAAIGNIIDRDIDRAVAGAAKMSDAAARGRQRALQAAEKTLAAERRLDDKRVNDLLAGFDKQAQAKAAAEAKALSATQRYMDREAKLYRTAMTEAEVSRTVSNRRIELGNKARVDAALRDAGVEQKSFGDTALSVGGLETSVTGAALALTGLRAGETVVRGLASAFGEARTNAEAMAKEAIDTLSSLREIANIQGKSAPDMASLAQHAVVMNASGLTQDEAVAHRTELGNAIGAIPDERLSQEERAKLEVGGAQFAVRGGRGVGNVKPRSFLLGALPNFMTPKDGKSLKSGEVLDMAARVDEINQLGMGDQKQTAEQYNRLLSATTNEGLAGYFKSPTSAAAMNAMASRWNKEGSSTSALQATREIRGLTKFRVGTGLKTSQGKFLEEAGVKEDQDPMEAMTNLFAYIDKTFGEKENIQTGLNRRGFRGQEGTEQLAQYFALWKSGDFDRIRQKADAPIVEGQAERKFGEFRASDLGQNLLAQADLTTSKVQRGVPEIPLNTARTRAEASLVRGGLDDTALGTIAQKGMSMASLGGRSGRDVLITERAMQTAYKDAGVRDPYERTPIERAPFAMVPGGPVLEGALDALTPLFRDLLGQNAKTLEELRQIRESNAKIAASQQSSAMRTPGALPPAPHGTATKQ